jgi:hypothetical protein
MTITNSKILSNGAHLPQVIGTATVKQASCTLAQSGAWDGNCAVALNPQVLNNTGTGTFQTGWTSAALEWPCIIVPSEQSF